MLIVLEYKLKYKSYVGVSADLGKARSNVLSEGRLSKRHVFVLTFALNVKAQAIFAAILLLLVHAIKWIDLLILN